MSLPASRKRILHNVMELYRNNLKDANYSHQVMERYIQATRAISDRLNQDRAHLEQVAREIRDRQELEKQLTLW